jgi:hypothetical protein
MRLDLLIFPSNQASIALLYYGANISRLGRSYFEISMQQGYFEVFA